MQAESSPSNSHILSNGLFDGSAARSREANGYATIPISPSSSSSAAASLSPPTSFSHSGVNYIEHRVSKMDTLAGVAIKYGVEVADIKRMNGLVTDLQMFAHKSLQIPLPGRHPPSPVLSNGSTHNGDRTRTRRPQSHDSILDSLQSLKLKPPSRRVSPAMCSLQGYYGLTQPKKGLLPEGTEMAVYKSGKALLFEDETLLETPTSHPVYSHRKSRSLANVSLLENGDISEGITGSDRSIRRHQKTDAKPPSRTLEILLKEYSAGGAFSERAGKGLALRPKPGNRTDLATSRQTPASGSDSPLEAVCVSVRKSSSTSSLSESENSSSIWPTSKWSLKPDVIARPIFDGLPKPITGRRNKAALD